MSRAAALAHNAACMDTVTASTTLLGDTTLALRRAPAVPALCEAGAIVRALLFVEVMVTAGAAVSGSDA